VRIKTIFRDSALLLAERQGRSVHRSEGSIAGPPLRIQQGTPTSPTTPPAASALLVAHCRSYVDGPAGASPESRRSSVHHTEVLRREGMELSLSRGPFRQRRTGGAEPRSADAPSMPRASQKGWTESRWPFQVGFLAPHWPILEAGAAWPAHRHSFLRRLCHSPCPPAREKPERSTQRRQRRALHPPPRTR
jgi:hypothetical protein